MTLHPEVEAFMADLEATCVAAPRAVEVLPPPKRRSVALLIAVVVIVWAVCAVALLLLVGGHQTAAPAPAREDFTWVGSVQVPPSCPAQLGRCGR